MTSQQEHGQGLVTSRDPAMLKAVIAVLISRLGGTVHITQQDMDRVAGLLLVDRWDAGTDTAVVAVVERDNPLVPPGFGRVQ